MLNTCLGRWTLRTSFALGLLLTSWSLAADDGAMPPGTIPLQGHTATVYAIAFSPDGKFVVTGSFDKTIKLWDTATGKEIKTFGGTGGHQNLVLSLAFHPAGHSIASGSSDNTVKLWDIPSSSPLREFLAADAVNRVALTPDNKLLAAAGKDGSVKLWNTADGKPLFNLTGHAGPVTDVAFNSKGLLLASSGSDGTVRFWDVAKGLPLGAVGAHRGAANAVLFHNTDTYVASVGDDGLLKFWQLTPTAARALPPHGDAVTALMLSPDGNQIFSASADKTVRVSAFTTGQTTKQYAGPAAAVTALAAGGTLVAGGTADQRLFLWNAADGKVVSQGIAHQGAVTGVAFHPQATQLLTAGADGLLKLWALPPVPGRVLPHPDGVTAMSLSADGKRLVTGGADKIVRTWGLATPQGTMERQYAGHTAPVTAVALSPNGQVLVSGGADAAIRFWNQTNGQPADQFGGHAGPVTTLAFHPNGLQLLSASEDGTVKLWQLPPVPTKLFAHPGALTSAAVSPDGAKLVTGSDDKQIRLWNLTSGQMERAIPGNTVAVTTVAFSPNGTAMAAGGADKSVTVWNAADGKELKKFANLPAAVQSVAFSADGTQVAAGLADNSLRLLDIASGKEVKNLAGHAGVVTALAYTPKGDQIVSAGADKAVHIWNVAAGMSKLKLDAGTAVHCLAVSKDGARVAAGGADKTVKVWTLADGKPAVTVTTPAEVRGVGFSPDGTRLVVGGTDGKARVYGLDGKLREFFSHDGPIVAAAYHADGKRIVTAAADKTARLWTTALLWQAAHAGPVRQAAFSAKGDRIVSGGDDKTIAVWSAADGKEIKRIAAHEGPVIGVGLSADGQRIVSGGADRTVKVWTLDAPKPLAFVNLAAVPESVAISPNGLRIAAAFADKTGRKVPVFDVASGKELMHFADHTAAVRGLAFAADNRTLISAGLDKTARFSDVGALAVLDAHPGGVAGVAFHSNPAQPQALSGGADKTVKLWALATGKVLRTFGPLTEPVGAVAFSKDCTQVGAAAGKTVKVWSAADGKEIVTLNHPAPVLALSFSADKTRMVTGSADNTTRVWDLAIGQELQSYRQGGPVRAVAYHPATQAVVTGGADKTLTVHPVNATRAIAVSTGPVRGLAVTPNGSHFLTGADDKTAKLWNIAKGTADQQLAGTAGPVNAVAVSKNGLLAATGGADKAIRVYTLADGKMIGTIPAPAPVRGLSFSPNSLALAGACDNGAVAAWDVPFAAGQPVSPEFGKPVQNFTHAMPATSVVFAADSATLYSGSLDKTVKAWKVAASGATRSLPHPNLVDAVAFDPTGNRLATGCHDGQLRIWDLTKMPQPQVTKAIVAHTAKGQEPGAIYSVAWTPDGKQLLSASFDRSLKLWDATSGGLVREFKGHDAKTFPKGHQQGVFSAAFSPDGKFVVSGGDDRIINVWNTADGSVVRQLLNPNLKANQPDAKGQLLQPPQAHPGAIYGVRFAPNGKYILSAGHAPRNQGYLALWNAADGKLVYAAELPSGHINTVSVSTDGKLLAIGVAPRERQAAAGNGYILRMPDAAK